MSADPASDARIKPSPSVLAIGLVLLSAVLLALASPASSLGLVVALVGLGLALLVGLDRLRDLAQPRTGALSDDRQQALISLLERIAEALETHPRSHSAGVSADPLDEVREAIRESRWADVLDRIEALRAEDNLAPEFEAEVSRHRESAETDLRARMNASRQANDAESVLSYRAQLVPLLSEEIRLQLDAELIRWFMALMMRRMRTGTVRADVASLAEAIAETFPATSEGASLRASLPTLRRSAGLCPRCSEPYTGVNDACPKCLGTEEDEAPVEIPLVEPELDDDLPPVERNDEDDPFLRSED